MDAELELRKFIPMEGRTARESLFMNIQTSALPNPLTYEIFGISNFVRLALTCIIINFYQHMFRHAMILSGLL